MGTVPIIQRETLFECWEGINNYLIFEDKEPVTLENLEGSWLLNRDFGLSKFNMTLRAERFGLPDVPPPFFTWNRLDVLKKRYVNQALWDEGVNRIAKKGDKMASPMTFTVMFHRRDTSEMKVPTGGGCLVAMHLLIFKKKYRLHFTMRASEVTCRLLSDMYFFRMMAREMQEAVAKKNKFLAKNLDVDNIPIDITILLASQVKHYIPIFMLFQQGPEAVEKFFTSKPKTEWQARLLHHFFEDFIWPENITWSQRKKWSEKFYDWHEELTGQSVDFRTWVDRRGDAGMFAPKQFRGKYITERAKKWVDKDEPEVVKRANKRIISVDFKGVEAPEPKRIIRVNEFPPSDALHARMPQAVKQPFRALL